MPVKQLAIGALAISLTGGSALAQSAQPLMPPLRFDSPTSGIVQGAYDCMGQAVRLELSLAAGRVEVREFRSGDRSLSPDELERWNTALRDIRRFDSYGFACQVDNAQVVAIRGLGAEGGRELLIQAEQRQGRFMVHPGR